MQLEDFETRLLQKSEVICDLSEVSGDSGTHSAGCDIAEEFSHAQCTDHDDMTMCFLACKSRVQCSLTIASLASSRDQRLSTRTNNSQRKKTLRRHGVKPQASLAGALQVMCRSSAE